MRAFEDAFAKVISLALEDWGMMLVEAGENPAASFSACEYLYFGWTEFHSVTNGKVTVLCDGKFADILCRNVLGVDEDEVMLESDLRDAVRELTNVISGNLLTETYGEDVVFDLMYPQVGAVAAKDIESFLAQRFTYYCLADGKPLAVGFSRVEE